MIAWVLVVWLTEFLVPLPQLQKQLMIYAICDFLEMDGEEDSQEMTVWKKINRGALFPNIHRDLHKVRDDMQKQDSQVKLEEKKKYYHRAFHKPNIFHHFQKPNMSTS